MDQSYESLMSMSEHRPMLVSPYLSTQINETVCSCRCGCGCNCAGHGNDGDYDQRSESQSDTAVGSSASENGEQFSTGQHVHEDDSHGDRFDHLDENILSPRAVSQHGLVWLLEQIGEPAVRWQRTALGAPLGRHLEDPVDSLFNEAPKTDSRSNAVFEHGHLQRQSPVPGIDALFVSDGTEDIELVYYFDVRPLRLSAEFEHARGGANEHLLIPDENSLLTSKH
ncbi:uncharacterized protein M421DRAFT_416976 [Didymella exigua CBS 183.55]|uniref:Uncharacterized protein n=1 Tax=Didymella exigua CBS 183.55 TaxID=1150837 RepID=A0A6A5RUW0_9PLEO|nr:uncharacterized protein M421DRAFT_416976 [Didymella exigua CBS 183.55]KAF1932255.1 hypothetical protein M421DRAFT_416976 [Didymella exigua CBS 183.55]